MMYPGSYFGALRKHIVLLRAQTFFACFSPLTLQMWSEAYRVVVASSGRHRIPTSGHLPAALFFTKLTAMSLPVCRT